MRSQRAGMTSHTTTRRSPLSLRVGIADRLRWRRTVRRVLAEHDRDLLIRIRHLEGQPVTLLVATPSGFIRIRVPGWDIDITDVGPGALARLQACVQGTASFQGGGRYGRFWWVAVTQNELSPPTRAIVLGSRIRLTKHHDGPTDSSRGPALLALGGTG